MIFLLTVLLLSPPAGCLVEIFAEWQDPTADVLWIDCSSDCVFGGCNICRAYLWQVDIPGQDPAAKKARTYVRRTTFDLTTGGLGTSYGCVEVASELEVRDPNPSNPGATKKWIFRTSRVCEEVADCDLKVITYTLFYEIKDEGVPFSPDYNEGTALATVSYRCWPACP